jgi:hypothetical protein
LLRCIGNVVFTTDYMGDLHGVVVHHNHEVVERITDLIRRSASGDHHVATKIAPAPTHCSAYKVIPVDVRIVIDAKADHSIPTFGLECGFLLCGEISVAVVVTGSLFGCLLCISHGCQLRFVGVTAIGQAFVEERPNGVAMLLRPVRFESQGLLPSRFRAIGGPQGCSG